MQEVVTQNSNEPKCKGESWSSVIPNVWIPTGLHDDTTGKHTMLRKASSEIKEVLPRVLELR